VGSGRGRAVTDEPGSAQEVMVLDRAEDCCREHRHEPDSKHFDHLIWPQIRRFCLVIGRSARPFDHSV